MTAGWADTRPTIVGAGLAGSLMALLLAQRGLRVHVYERNPDLRRVTAPAGRSINLALAERGIHALKKAGVFRAAQELLIPMRGRMLHEPGHEPKLQPYSRNPDEVNYSVSRAGLTRVLLDAAEATGRVTFHFRHKLSECNPGTGYLRFESHQGVRELSLDGQPLIAADGAGSSIRRALGARKLVMASENLLEHRYKELTIPAAPDGSFRIDAGALHIWPRGGFMLIALPNPDATFTGTLFMPAAGDPGFSSLDSAAHIRAFFAREFPDTGDLFPELEQEFMRNPVGVMGTVRCEPWYATGPTLLIGDAAHAIVPFHGQGMNCAFEDCAVFDSLLQDGASDWQSTCEHFSNLRKPDADAIADMALENYVEMRDTVRDPKFHLRKALAWELEARHPQRFVPRYSMVMFRRIPYARAQARGAVQAHILETLSTDAATLADIDMNRAARLVRESLPLLDDSELVG